MKNNNLIPVVTFLLLFFAGSQLGCSSSKTSSSSKTDSSADTESVSKSEPDYGYTSLLEMMRKESAIRISGPSSNPVIRVAGGGRSVSGSSEPLFVVDGAAVGKGYQSVRSIDVNTVSSITVLSPAKAAIYGARAGMGVIEIKTKTR